MNMDEIMLTFLKYNDSNNERKKTANKANHSNSERKTNKQTNKQNKQTIQIISFLSIICFVQIIESSHKCGRLDHVLTYGQLAVTDPSRVDKIMERFPMKYCLLNPGMIYILLCRWSVVFFCIYENLQHNEDYFPGHDRMIVGFTITYAISAYHH
jgi:hypothetical protein